MKKKWTAEENKLLREHYPGKSAKSILHLFQGRTVSQIQGHAYIIGLRKSEAFFLGPQSGRISDKNDIGIETRFAPLQPGWNKGLKQQDYMSAESIAKTAKTRWKKGQDPHNTVTIGTERISKDNYIEVKVRHLKNGDAKNKNFEFKHRMMYEKYQGSIPAGAKVYFIDGNLRNFSIENLAIETHAENLIKNSMCDTSIVKRFLGVREPELVTKIINEMPEVIDLKRNAIKLTQKINKQHAKRTT